MIAGYLTERRNRGEGRSSARLRLSLLATLGVAVAGSTPLLAADPGKHACFEDAKRLCPAEMNSLSRAKVRACMIVHLEQTSPQCHDYMIAERDAVLRGRKPDAVAQ